MNSPYASWNHNAVDDRRLGIFIGAIISEAEGGLVGREETSGF